MIIDFLRSTRRKEHLRTALAVILEFKKCEGTTEWAACPLVAWAKLEQLEEFLEHMVNGKPLKEDTLAELAKER